MSFVCNNFPITFSLVVQLMAFKFINVASWRSPRRGVLIILLSLLERREESLSGVWPGRDENALTLHLLLFSA